MTRPPGNAGNGQGKDGTLQGCRRLGHGLSILDHLAQHHEARTAAGPRACKLERSHGDVERVQQAVAYADEEQQDQKGDAERIEGDEEMASPFETNGDTRNTGTVATGSRMTIALRTRRRRNRSGSNTERNE